MRHICFTATLALLAGTALAGQRADAAADTPEVHNGIESVCTGVGSAKDDPKWAAYPVKVVFSNGAQEFVAGEHVTLGRGDQTLVEVDCDGPWMLFKAPAGQYKVTAWLDGHHDAARSASFTTDGPSSTQQKVEISFATPRTDQSTLGGQGQQ